MSKHSLKAKNLKFVVTVLIIDIVILFVILSGDRINSLPILGDWPPNLVKSGAIISIASITGLLINHLIPPNLKATIVFWRLWHALPGCRAFSNLIHKDSRIDVTALQKKLGTLPTDKKEQNVLWYRLFKQHESNTAIKEAHQRFLFFRDITSMTALVLAFLLVITYLDISNINTYKYAFIFIIGQYLLFMVAARNTANRLVQNVLALEAVSTKLIKRK